MREDPIISGGWVKAALVILVAGALGVGAYVLASGVHINLPDLPDVGTSTDATTLSDTTLESTTIGVTTTRSTATVSTTTPQSKTKPSPGPTIQDLQELGQCTQAANGDIDKINACFDKFNSSG
jgi:hypothetical protein